MSEVGVGTKLLSVSHAAEQLDCSRGHVYRLIATGKLRAVEISISTRSKTRVYADEIEELIAASTRRAG